MVIVIVTTVCPGDMIGAQSSTQTWHVPRMVAATREVGMMARRVMACKVGTLNLTVENRNVHAALAARGAAIVRLQTRRGGEIV